MCGCGEILIGFADAGLAMADMAATAIWSVAVNMILCCCPY